MLQEGLEHPLHRVSQSTVHAIAAPGSFMRSLLKVCVLGPGSGIRDDFSAFKQTSQVALLHRVIW